MAAETYRYNAFISYRRTPRDTLVAREIQHGLEQFRLPKGIRQKSGKDRIERIFRDQSELEITSDLSGRIESALASSEYLIVICSPEYSESPWCLHELETFLSMRGHDRVLCVLSNGEPPSVFPEALLRRTREVTADDGTAAVVEESVEPLACDYRESFRTARRTELPRLAAAMLGCSYDELVMRRERYRRRRLASILTAAAASASIAIAYLIWSNTQISRNYRQALISESRLLASESLSALEEQDRLHAVTDALQALTGNDPERPVTEEAQFALSRATYAYETPSKTVETWRIDLNNDIRDFFVSRDGQMLVCMDRTGEFCSYSIRDRKLLSRFRIAENTVPATPAEGKSGQLLCYANGEVVCADYLTGETVWHEPMNYGALGAVKVSPQGNLIAAADSYAVWVMTTEQLPYAGLLLPELDGQYITDLCWSEDGSCIAVKLRQPGTGQDFVGSFALETGAFTLLDCSYETVDLFRFDRENRLYILGDNRIGESDSYNGATVLIPVPFELRVYSGSELMWSYQLGAQTLTDTPALEIAEEAERRVYLALGSAVYIFDKDGTAAGYLDMRRDVVRLLDIGNETFSFITSEGDLGTGWPASGISQLNKTFPAGITRAVTVPYTQGEDESFVILSAGNLCVYESVSDGNLKPLSGDGFVYRPDGMIRDGDRSVLLTENTLLFYALQDNAQTARVDLPEGDVWHLLTALGETVHVLRIHGNSGETFVLSYDLQSGELLREMQLPVKDFFCDSGYMSAPFSHADAVYLSAMYQTPSAAVVCGEDLYIHDAASNEIWHLCLTTGELTGVPVAFPENSGSFDFIYEENGFLLPSPLAVSPDGRFLFTAGTSPKDGSRTALLVHLEDGTVTLLPGTPYDLTSVAFDSGPSGKTDTVLYAGQRELFACSTDGKLLYSIPWTGDNPVSFAMREGRIYCVFPNAVLGIYERDKELRSIPLTFSLLNTVANGRDFRYDFTNQRLYLYCGADLNVIALDSDGTTPVYTAGCVLDCRTENNMLYLFSQMPQNGTESRLFYLTAISEYSPAALADRAGIQLNGFVPMNDNG